MPRQEKAILCGYYIFQILENGEKLIQANLKDFFNALIEATFTSEEFREIQQKDAELQNHEKS